MEVAIGKRVLRNVDAVAVARMVAEAFRFDVDLEPLEPGRYRLTAKSGDAVIKFAGTRTEVCERFVNQLIGE